MAGDLENVDIGAMSACNGGKFEADKPGADDDHLARLAQPRPQDIRIGEGPQRQHAIELGPGNRERPVASTRGEDEIFPGNLKTRGQLEATPSSIDRRHRVTVDEFDLLLGVEFSWPQPQIIDTGFTG